ncbi:MAG: SEC-C domain-containing protein [Lachnospiraceae bacterium]|nr:SEC-C domain-containing protein [Lachnospiraceae bacterium]
MKLLDVWRSKAYDERADKSQLQPIWNTYFAKEKEFYQKLLPEKEVVKGTVTELCEKYGVDTFYMTGILDGINDSLVTPNPIEEMEEDTMISLEYDKELLYKNMVAAGADWLYNLKEWDEYFTEEEKKALYKEQKASTTIKKDAKVYPNDPCPCGSGKKYKKCCGKNA